MKTGSACTLVLALTIACGPLPARAADSTHEAKEQFAQRGAEAVTGTPERFRKRAQHEIAQNAELVKAAGLKVE